MTNNWCFGVVILEKTLESPLDNEEIKLVNPKEFQPWILIGMAGAESKAPVEPKVGKAPNDMVR